jgi:hypothetical protein
VKRAACPIHVPGEDAPAQIQFQDLAEISRSSNGVNVASTLDVNIASTLDVNVASTLDVNVASTLDKKIRCHGQVTFAIPT